MKVNFEDFNDKELMDIITSAQYELEFRKSKKENELWDKVVAAIQNYTDEIGAIEVKDSTGSIYFTANFDASLPGRICAK